jgi:Abhydrolase family
MQRRTFLGSLGLGMTAAACGGPLSLSQAHSAESIKRKTFKTNREDGRFQETAGFLQNQMKTNPPKLAFNPQMKKAEFPAWQKAVREKLRELLAFPEVPKQPEPKRLWIRHREGYQLQKWEAYPEPGSVVPFMVLIPDGITQSHPAATVMCFPGSTWSLESLVGEPEVGKKAKDNVKNRTDWKWQDNRMALHIAQQGMVSIAVANPATNDTDSPLRGRAQTSINAILLGRCYLGISAFQKAHIMEWASRQPFVDKNRIGVCGHSLGSEPADVLGVLYPDLVKAIVHNDFCCNWIERTIVMNGEPVSDHHVIPGMYQWFDATDWEASLAPRPLLFTEGGRANQLAKIEAAYRLNGAEDKLKIYYYKKYSTPADRPFDFKPIPEGLTVEEYFQYANVDAPRHVFRPKRVVPWLKEVL